MSKTRTSERRARTLSTAIFLLLLAYFFYQGSPWTLLFLVVGIPLAVRQFLLGRRHDALISTAIFGLLYFSTITTISWNLILPILFTLGGIYLLLREWMESRTKSEVEQEEDLNIEIEIEESKEDI